MRKINVVILVLCFSLQLKGQQNNTLFLMHDLPQSNIVNPAVPIHCKWFVGIPGVGSTHINAFSTGFALSDILVSTSGDSLRLELDEALKNFSTNEMVATETHLSLFSLGYKYKQNYFTFGVNEKVNSYTMINKNAALLIHGGNTQFEGERIKMNGTRVNGMHYREYALGWARTMDEKLSLGFRLKLLLGKANIYTKPLQMSLYTHPVTFDTYVSGSGNGYISLPVDVTVEPDGTLGTMDWQQNIKAGDYLMNRENKGLGADFGFVYQLSRKTMLAGSLLDIGYVNWSSDVYQLNSSGAMDITGAAIDEGLGNLSDITDSLKNMFSPRLLNESYKSPLLPAMYLGVSHEVLTWLNVGAVFHTELYKKRLHPSFTFSGNASMIKNIYGTASYTLQNGEFNNLGAGIGARFGVVHIHAVSDNIPALFNLTAARNINLRFGLSLLLGCGREKKRSADDNGIRAIPCFNDPYKTPNIRPRKKKR